MLLEEHIANLRKLPGCSSSHITVFVERNLGYEAHHHKRALGHLPVSARYTLSSLSSPEGYNLTLSACVDSQGVTFYVDEHYDQVGILTTNPIKHAMAELVVVMLSEQRIHIRKPSIVSKDARGMLLKMREQLEVYSYQFKAGQDTFQKDRIAISGKVGGMRDDIAICLQLACYWTQLQVQRCVKRVRLQ